MQKYFSINQNGCSVRCKLYCRDPAAVKKAIIFGHGFAGHKDNGTAELFADRVMKRHKDTAIIVFNWPCHGDDALPKLTLDACMNYLNLVTHYARERCHAEELYACATSFGGYLFLKYLSENPNPFERIALRCPAVDMYDVLTQRIMTGEDLAALSKGKPVMIGFDRMVKVTSGFIDELRESDITRRDYTSLADRILIVHGTRDEIVPFGTVRDFADRNGVSFSPYEGADHRFLNPTHKDLAISEMIAFLGL